jgi:hypothetical protein
MMTGVQPSEFETDCIWKALQDKDLTVDPAAVQVIAGWVLRAYLAGTRQPKLTLEVPQSARDLS